MPEISSPSERLAALTAQVVTAYVGHNTIAATELPALMATVYQGLSRLGQSSVTDSRPEPAVSPKKSVFPDYIICLEDGKKLKMLKRHLSTHYNLTPDQYRARWGLPSDYPMVAPNYAEKRRALAKAIGLGRKPGARRGRKPKVA